MTAAAARGLHVRRPLPYDRAIREELMHVNDQIGKLETVRDRLQERVDRNLKRDPLVAAKMQQKLDVAQAQLQALSRKGEPEV